MIEDGSCKQYEEKRKKRERELTVRSDAIKNARRLKKAQKHRQMTIVAVQQGGIEEYVEVAKDLKKEAEDVWGKEDEVKEECQLTNMMLPLTLSGILESVCRAVPPDMRWLMALSLSVNLMKQKERVVGNEWEVLLEVSLSEGGEGRFWSANVSVSNISIATARRPQLRRH